MKYTDYILLQEGFANKRKYEQRLLRRAVVKLLEPYVKQGAILDERRIWPVDGDEKSGGVFISQKYIEKLKKLREDAGNDSANKG